MHTKASLRQVSLARQASLRQAAAKADVSPARRVSLRQAAAKADASPARQVSLKRLDMEAANANVIKPNTGYM